MRPFDHHIYSLLLDHDCVIVPTLGGFIASREGARFDAGRQLVLPPGKTIAFNVYLKQNDGLLARRIVDTEKVSYPEAMQEIETYVARCMTELGRGEKVSIRKVGRLSMDGSSTLRFEQDPESALLPEAFGLTAVPVQAVAGKSTLKSISHKQEKSAKRNRNRDRSLIAALVVAGALAWFAVNVYLTNRDRYDKAGINPIDSVIPDVKENPVITPPAPVKVETVYVATPPPVVEETTQVVKQDSTAVRTTKVPGTSQEAGDYYVVAGVFRVRENADRLVAGLQAEGFQDVSIIDTNRRLFYVSYGCFKTHREAASRNDLLRKQSKESWIYLRK